MNEHFDKLHPTRQSAVRVAATTASPVTRTDMAVTATTTPTTTTTTRYAATTTTTTCTTTTCTTTTAGPKRRPVFSQHRSDFSTAPEPVAAKAEPGAENSKFHCGDHDHSQQNGCWDDLQQSRRNLEDDAGVGGAKQRLEPFDPANVSTNDEWGDDPATTKTTTICRTSLPGSSPTTGAPSPSD